MKRALQVGLLRALTFGWRLISDSPAAGVLEQPLLSRWKERLLKTRRPYDSMAAAEVIRLLDGFDGVGVQVWLMGGWGVDALLGRESRSHSDLDLIVAADNEALRSVQTVLRALGYSRQFEEVFSGDDPMNLRLVAANSIGQCVDVHPVDLASPPFSPREPDAAIMSAALITGQLAGHTVPCVSAEVHLALKRFQEQRSPLSAKDDRDIALMQMLTAGGREGRTECPP
jgi:lincosamide nucleotidyltransferase A/C/D/E